jgi:hypothetical protein
MSVPSRFVSVAVVVAFFVSWAPFHAQRLMVIYTEEWTNTHDVIHRLLFYVSGVLYYVSATINPILYSIMSLKFRQAFKQTLLEPWCCCPKYQRRRNSSRPYFSYKFAHRNGYTETSFTSLEGGSPSRGGSRSRSEGSSDRDPRPATTVNRLPTPPRGRSITR